MRDPERIDQTLAAVRLYWEKYPDLRLGQLIENASVASGYMGSAYMVEDDELIAGIWNLHRMHADDAVRRMQERSSSDPKEEP